MRYIELFAGVGGFRLGIERAKSGATCVFSNEWDKYAAQTYNKNFGGQIDTRDITIIDEREIPDHDLLVGGFPCQAFSIAGKRKGFEETRGTLFFDIARILKHKRPRHLLLENVKGLLTHDEGKTFQTILGVLTDLGYGVEWQVLNSKDFGVPQNRERIFIVGHLRGESRSQVFPIFGNNSEGFSPTLRATYYKGYQTRGPMIKEVAHLSKGQSGRVYGSKTVRSGGKASPRGSKQNWDSYDIGGGIRRLTPLECERLQGFPDGWTEGVSDMQRYKQMGNAVTVNVIEAVVRRMYE